MPIFDAMPHFPLSGLEPLAAHSIYCIGRNYAEHARELNNPIPESPVVFTKPTASLLASGGTVLIPDSTDDVHHETELVVAIGTGGKHIPVAEAWTHVAGLAVGLDMTARDVQSRLKEKSHPWDLAKGLDTFAPIGNFVPVAAFPNPDAIGLTLHVNGQLRQQGSTADMLHPVPALIAYLSRHFTLYPGDLIFTGTPAGVARVLPGDRLEARLAEGVSALAVSVARA